jgi:urea carboxylase
MCIYGMEGPGGYQFVGRTVQVWNRYRSTASFKEGKPWLLRFFDQIKYYPVSEEELVQLRHDFPQGRFEPKIEEGHFSLSEYQAFLDKNDESIKSFKAKQQAAFDVERAHWKATGLDKYVEEEAMSAEEDGASIPEGAEPVESPVAGSVWKILIAEVGQQVEAGETLAVLESMKMEIKVEAPISGTLSVCLCKEGQAVQPGQALFGMTPAIR